jgi:8-oxo-dGTP diphosphatase
MTEVKFFDPDFEPGEKLIYSIIAARYSGSWIFVRHKNRNTFEIPAGHVENNESTFEAAARELREETGAISFRLDCVATYSVEKDGKTGFGRLYLADISDIGPLPENSEIGEVIIMDHLPGNLTHPDVQPELFNRIIEYLDETGET